MAPLSTSANDQISGQAQNPQSTKSCIGVNYQDRQREFRATGVCGRQEEFAVWPEAIVIRRESEVGRD